jgi:hypothetical protein
VLAAAGQGITRFICRTKSVLLPLPTSAAPGREVGECQEFIIGSPQCCWCFAVRSFGVCTFKEMAQEHFRVSGRATKSPCPELSHPARVQLAEVVPFPGTREASPFDRNQAPLLTRVITFLRAQATATGTPPLPASSPDPLVTNHPSHVSVFGALRMPDDVA